MNSKKGKKQEEKYLPKPTEIKALLDEYVIGQDEAKKTLSVIPIFIKEHFYEERNCYQRRRHYAIAGKAI